MMGGKIWVESEPKRGSTFCFTIKLDVVDAESKSQRRAVVVCDTPALIVDDNATNRRILFDMLTNWGMKPSLANGAREAFDHLQDAARRGRPFRIVLLDVNMPEVDGFELAAWIRDDRELADTPIVLLTSSSRVGDSDRRTALGISHHLLKPVKQSEVFDAIVLALGVTDVDDHEEHDAGASESLTFGGLRVLLAEDNAVNQKLAVGVLEKLGCDVTVAEDGRQAVAAWETQDFDVVLMDVQMPEMDGLEATRTIRLHEQDSGRHTVIRTEEWPTEGPVGRVSRLRRRLREIRPSCRSCCAWRCQVLRQAQPVLHIHSLVSQSSIQLQPHLFGRDVRIHGQLDNANTA